MSNSIQDAGDIPDKKALLALYSVANEQNKLYADFRWRVLSFMSTLEAALLYAVVQAAQPKHRVIYSIAGIIVTVFLLALEERHKTIFYQTRIAAQTIEDRLGVSDYGVFTAENKTKGKHNLIVRLWCIVLVAAWIVSLAVFLSKI